MTPGSANAMPAATPVVISRARIESPEFFVWMAYGCALIAIVGFLPTYWAPVASRTFNSAPIVHLHGLLFSAWPLLFIAQARSAAAGRFERHRALGLAGISVATAMLFTGMAVAIHSIGRGISLGFDAQSRAFSIVPITIVWSFAALVAAAIANVRHPDVHLRLMVAASISILPPAIARMIFLALAPDGAPPPGAGEPPAVAFSLLPSFIANLLIAIAMTYDWRTRGRPHRAYVLALVFLVVVQIARVPFSGTATWHAITSWLLSIS